MVAGYAAREPNTSNFDGASSLHLICATTTPRRTRPVSRPSWKPKRGSNHLFNLESGDVAAGFTSLRNPIACGGIAWS